MLVNSCCKPHVFNLDPGKHGSVSDIRFHAVMLRKYIRFPILLLLIL